jgi:hypothetical protein
MGGAVARVVSPVAKVVDKVAGTNITGKDKPSAPAPTPTPTETPMTRASRSEEEMGARMRGARRRGRQLLSDARLNAEAGIETLGRGNNLG